MKPVLERGIDLVCHPQQAHFIMFEESKCRKLCQSQEVELTFSVILSRLFSFVFEECNCRGLSQSQEVELTFCVILS